MNFVVSRIVSVKDQWFPAARLGPTGCGFTLESSVFGKVEDNKAEADIDGAELKSVTRAKPHLSKRLRAFTNNSGAEQDLLRRFGREGSDGVVRFSKAMRNNGRNSLNGYAPRITQDEKRVYLVTGSETLSSWTKESFVPIFCNKLNNLAVVSTIKRKLVEITEFNYYHCEYFTGFCQDRFWEMMDDGRVSVEFRVNEHHDHGTCFNITTKNLMHLYRSRVSSDD